MLDPRYNPPYRLPKNPRDWIDPRRIEMQINHQRLLEQTKNTINDPRSWEDPRLKEMRLNHQRTVEQNKNNPNDPMNWRDLDKDRVARKTIEHNYPLTDFFLDIYSKENKTCTNCGKKTQHHKKDPDWIVNYPPPKNPFPYQEKQEGKECDWKEYKTIAKIVLEKTSKTEEEPIPPEEGVVGGTPGKKKTTITTYEFTFFDIYGVALNLDFKMRTIETVNTSYGYIGGQYKTLNKASFVYQSTNIDTNADSTTKMEQKEIFYELESIVEEYEKLRKEANNNREFYDFPVTDASELTKYNRKFPLAEITWEAQCEKKKNPRIKKVRKVIGQYNDQGELTISE